MHTFNDIPTQYQHVLDGHTAQNGTYVRASFVRAMNGYGNAAILLSHFLWWSREQGGEDGWFYQTRSDIEERTGLGKRAQESARKRLKQFGVLEEEKRDIPAKLYYRLDYKVVLNRLLSPPNQDGSLMNQQDGAQGNQQGGSQADQQDGSLENRSTQKVEKKENGKVQRENAHAGKDWEQLDDPVAMLEAAFDYNANAHQADRIQQTVDDLDVWRDCVDHWLYGNHNPWSKKLLQMYKEEYEEQQSQSLATDPSEFGNFN